MKSFVSLMALIMALFCSPSFASAGPVNEAQVRLNLIHLMQDDGFLSEKMAGEAKLKYVDPKQLSAPVTVDTAASSMPALGSLLDRYLSWFNAIKVIGVVFILIAFWGGIQKLIKGIWHLIASVPVLAYQLPLLGLTVTLTLKPQMVWASQALYLAIFGSVANLLVLLWFAVTHEKFAMQVLKLFRLGLPPASVGSFWGMLYFGGLAVLYQSPIFGFAAAVCLSGVLSFGMYYSQGTLWLHFKEHAEGAVVFGHLAVLLIYLAVRINAPHAPAINLFGMGIEYYCTVAMCVGLLVGSAPWMRSEGAVGLYVLTFILVAVAASFGYFLLDIKVIGSIVMCFFILFCLEWLGYLGFQGGVIAGCAILGFSLFGVAVLMEHYSNYIVLATV